MDKAPVGSHGIFSKISIISLRSLSISVVKEVFRDPPTPNIDYLHYSWLLHRTEQHNPIVEDTIYFGLRTQWESSWR